jgi:hypothetical protein
MQCVYETFVKTDELQGSDPYEPRVQALVQERTHVTQSLKRFLDGHGWTFLYDTTQPIPTWAQETSGPPLVSFAPWLSQ